MTTILLHLVVTVGMLVVVPVGLQLIGGLPVLLHRLWLAGAASGAVSLLLPRGLPAALLATGYGLATAALAASAPLRLLRRRRFAPRELAVLTALVTPAVAGISLVAERYGHRLLGFELETLSLTVAHFHFAGFAAALVAALVCAGAGDRPLANVAALGVPAGVVVVFTGFFTTELVELAGAAILTAGMWLVAYLTWHDIRPASTDPATRLLLGTSAVVLVGTMLLALSWAAGNAMDLPHPPLPVMVATHGVANALGFGMCAILAWQRLAARSTPGVPQWTH